jgi:ankyrin repeat protein
MISFSLTKKFTLVIGVTFLCGLMFLLWLRSEHGRQKSAKWVDRSYTVSFQWNGSLKSLSIIDNRTRRPESDPVLRRIASDESRRVVTEILKRAELERAEGRFNLTLSGPAEPYLMTWSAPDIPKLDELMHAAATWDLETIKRIIGDGVNVNARALDSDNTALILAATNPASFRPTRLSRLDRPPDSKTVQYLLTAGANPNAKGYLGSTALMRTTDSSIARDLINHGANLNIADDKGWTALVYAVDGHNPPIVRILLNAGAQVDAKDKRGWTPLMYAVDEGDIDVTKVLLASGASPEIRNKQGETALDIARQTQGPMDRAIIQLLSSRFHKSRSNS